MKKILHMYKLCICHICLIYNLKALHHCHICTCTLRRAFHTWCVGMPVIHAHINFTCLAPNIYQLSPSDQQLQKIFHPSTTLLLTFHKTIPSWKVALPVPFITFLHLPYKIIFIEWFILKLENWELSTARPDSHFRITDLQQSFHVFHLR